MAKENRTKVQIITKKVILWTLLGIALVLVGIVIISSFKNDLVSSESTIPPVSNLSGEYEEYVASYDAIYPTDYQYSVENSSNDAIMASYDETKTIALNNSLDDSEKLNGETGIFTDNDVDYEFRYSAKNGSIAYNVNVPETGFYNLVLEYIAMDDWNEDGTWESSGGADIERGILINDEYIYEDLEDVLFTRTWTDNGDPLIDIEGNEIKPAQAEIEKFHSSYIIDSIGYVSEPYLVYFEAGDNDITIESIKENMGIVNLFVASKEDDMDYAEYASLYSDQPVIANAEYKYEGENANYRSSSTIYAINDKTNAYTTTDDGRDTDPVTLILNTIGGTKWTDPGSWITWNVTVEKSGMYEISMRAKQNENRDLFSTRTLMIDDTVPFTEARNCKYTYGSDYSIVTLGDSEQSYLFYLEAGTHQLTLTTTLGDYASQIGRVQEVIDRLNTLYRAIIKRTGISPDPYIDYFSKTEGQAFIAEATTTFEECVVILDDVSNQISEISGTEGSVATELQTMTIQLNQFIDNYRKIQKSLSTFSTNISSLGTWILDISSQPLTVDWIEIHGTETDLPSANPNWFVARWFSIRSFVGSFFFDYESIGMTEGNAGWTDVDVWLLTSTTTGREQANAISSMLYDAQNEVISNNDTTSPLWGINVKLKVVAPTVLLTATLSGNGPDVALNIANGTPVNYALRGAVHDISEFDDFEEICTRFMDSSLTPYSYTDADGNTGTYALPYTQDFLVMFYREDIFEENGWDVPTTWEDVQLLIPELQIMNLQFYLPLNQLGATSIVNSVYASYLFQSMDDTSEAFYRSTTYVDGIGQSKVYMESNFDSEESMKAFEFWTSFYTDYSFPLAASFINRFRSGETPIGIAPFSTYNTLAVSAPEIKGKWGFSLLPGTKKIDDDGNAYLDYTSAASGTAVVMMEQRDSNATEEQNQTMYDASWNFMKWFTSTDVQVGYAREIESILGSAARHNTGTIDAFKELAWTNDELDVLMDQWENTVGIPEVPGGYYTGRNLENAFREVVNDDTPPRETLKDYIITINKEIDRKRAEFGLGTSTEYYELNPSADSSN